MELEIAGRVAGAIARTVEWATLHGTNCDRAPTAPLHVFLQVRDHASRSAGITSRANRSTVRSTSVSVRSPKANCATK